MKRLPILPLIVAAVLLPAVVWWAATWNYARLDRLRARYECYPVDTCSFELNDDGIPERVQTFVESRPGDPYHGRLQILLSPEGEEAALDVEFVYADNTLRTHIAYFEESGTKKVTIYDTVNDQQFYQWNGSRLVPSASPSYLETQVHAAMGLNDDTGGFNQRIFFTLAFATCCIAYYLVLIFATLIYFVWRKRRGTVEKLL